MKAMLVCFMLVIGGCARLFTSSTTAEYSGPDGRTISYTSDKEQVGLEAVYELDQEGRTKTVRIKVDKASTQDAAIQAAMQQWMQLSQTLNQLLPLLKAGAPVP